MKLFNAFVFGIMGILMLLSSCAADTEKKVEEKVEEVKNDVVDAAKDVKQVAEQAVPSGPSTTMEFEEMEWDFGKINEGDKVQHVFKFKNTGSEPLSINNAKGSCGCTVPEWPKEPIAPGATGEINVEFNSSKKPGMQTKRVTITANTEPPQTYLNIKADVTPAPKDEAAN